MTPHQIARAIGIAVVIGGALAFVGLIVGGWLAAFARWARR